MLRLSLRIQQSARHNIVVILVRPLWVIDTQLITRTLVEKSKQKPKKPPKYIFCLDTIKSVEIGDFWISRWETCFFICIKFCSDLQDHEIMDYLLYNKKKGFCLQMKIFRISDSAMAKHYIQERTKGRRKKNQLQRNVFLNYGGCLKSFSHLKLTQRLINEKRINLATFLPNFCNKWRQFYHIYFIKSPD